MIPVVMAVQVAMFRISDVFVRFLRTLHLVKRRARWVIGVDEMSGTIRDLASVMGSVVTVCLKRNRFFDYPYTYRITRPRNSFAYAFVRLIYGPMLFAYLLNVVDGFVYIWSTGFFSRHDYRRFEFRMIKKRSRKLVCFFVGSDIRSPRLILERSGDLKRDVPMTYHAVLTPRYLTRDHETRVRMIAEIADAYADHIFTARVDQLSYLKRETHPFFYIVRTERFRPDPAKFDNPHRMRILHAPSSPFTKGTPLVRAAIKRLEFEGVDFEYREIMNVPNDVVVEELGQAHIALAEFYSFMPGVFAVEAMASSCAVLCSADPEDEPSLPSWENPAWLVTKYWEVSEKLLWLCSHPERVREFAERGREWVHTHYAESVIRERLAHTLSVEDSIGS